MWNKILIYLACAVLPVVASAHGPSQGDLELYRSLVSRVLAHGRFQIPLPGGNPSELSYSWVPADPLYPQPVTAEFPLSATSSGFFRLFWEKVLATDDSFIDAGGEHIPLTCVYVAGQDNRYSGNVSPLIPELVMKVYLVANDFSCTGPINPNWPVSSPRMETWDTYVYFEIRDPTIMLPTEARVRFRWNEFSLVWVNP